MNKESYRAYLKSDKWKAKRQAVFDRALKNANSDNRFGVCEKCGYKPWKPCLQVHHLSYEHIGNERLEELIQLCPNCHKKMHQESKTVQA